MDDQDKSKYSRREFLKLFSVAATGVGVGAMMPPFLGLRDGLVAIPAAGGYLLVDTKKCAGCMSCMLACSLVHTGKENLSLSRIQVVQNPFGKFPFDVSVEQCRQCVQPACVQACQTGALHVDAAHGNMRMVDERKCIGCMRCMQVCPFMPARVQWNYEGKHAQKCDLCVNTPYWEAQGGLGGKQACVEVCPVRAIAFTDKIPVQEGDSGYQVNLRNENWGKLGFPTD